MSDHTSDTSPSSSRTLLLVILIGGWLLATFAGLWWFQQKNVRPFVGSNDDLAYLRPTSAAERLQPIFEQLPTAAGSQVTLLHFWNPDCLCNQLSQRHFDGLVSAFNATQMRIMVIAPAAISEQQLNEFRRLNGERMSIMREPEDLHLPASPALALFSPEGQLGYFGAYGFGALCTVDNDDFFPSIVRRMIAGEAYGPFANVAGSGCFCAWPGSHPDTSLSGD